MAISVLTRKDSYFVLKSTSVSDELVPEPTKDSEAQFLLKDRRTLSSLPYTFGMPSATWSRAKTTAAKATSVQMFENHWRIRHESSRFAQRITKVILLSELALVGHYPSNIRMAKDRQDIGIFPRGG